MNYGLFKQRKGNFLDLFIIIAVLFMTGVAIFTAVIIVNTVDDTQIFSDNAIAQGAIDTTQSTLLSFDNMMLFVVVGLSIFVILSSAFVFNHPAYFFVGIFLLFIAVVVAAIASNTFWVFTNQEAIIGTAASFPKMTFLMKNLPIYVAFMGIASAIAMFVGMRSQ